MGAAKEVTSAFARAQDYVTSATSQASAFLSNLNAIDWSLPPISYSAGAIPAQPSVPNLTAPNLTSVMFNAPGSLPSALSLDAPTTTIDNFTAAEPTLSMPVAPTISYGTIPTIPTIDSVAVPAAPTITTPSLPSLLSLGVVAFAGVDIHADWLTQLENVPTMNLVAPTPYSYARGPEYASALLSHLQTLVNNRLNGGTGLGPAVEQAIWDRSRDRETKIAQANVDEVMRKSEALGFKLPTGALSAQLREAEQAYYDKLSELSRDIAIKQADLEQTNLKETITAGMQLEATLVDHSYKMEQLAYETAKTYADNAIQVYNAQVENFRVLLQSYSTYAEAYKTVIQAELAKVEAYKAQLQGEQAKADINRSLVEQYKAQIEAGMASVKIYEAQIGAAQTLVQLEQAKIGAASEQIKAYVAGVNAETSKVEAYKASVQAESTKVEVYRTQAQVFSAKVGAQAEKARTELARYTALVQAKAAEWEGYKAAVAAEGERVRSVIGQNSTLVDAFKASAMAAEATAGAQARIWEAGIKQYETQQTLTLQQSKMNSDVLLATKQAHADAAKTGAQVYAQMISSAYSTVHATAAESFSEGNSVSYSYSNDTETTAPTTTLVGIA